MLRPAPQRGPGSGALLRATRGSGWPSASRANTSACRRSAARACSRSSRSWNTSTASSTRVGGCGAVIGGDGAGRAPSSASTSAWTSRSRRSCSRAGAATGVRAGGERQRADALVINADFAQAMTAAGARTRCAAAGPTRKIAGKKFSCSTFMLYLGVEGSFPIWPTTRSIWPRTTRRNIRRDRGGQESPTSPASTCRMPASTDPRWRRPATARSMCWCRWRTRIGDGASTGAEQRRATAALALERLQAHRPARHRKAHPLREDGDAARDGRTTMQCIAGATFNLAHDLGQMLHLRPRNRFEDLDGVYLVGGGTHPGSGLPVIFESARITSRAAGRGPGLGRCRTGGPASPMAREPTMASPAEHGSGRDRTMTARMIGGNRRRPRRAGGAACTLAARGHKVILFDKNPWLGGKAAVLAGRQRLSASTWARPS